MGTPEGVFSPLIHSNGFSLIPNMIQTADSVECPSCDTQFELDPQRIPPQGLHVLCGRCWRVFPVAGAQGALPEGDEAWRSWKPDSDVTGDDSKVSVEAAPEVEAGPEVDAAPEVGAGAQVEEGKEEEGKEEGDWSPFEEYGAQSGSPTASEEAAPPPVTEEIPPTPPQGEPVVDSGVASGGASTQGAPVNPFARRDPHDRARRLARVLASDIVSYYGQRYTRALAAGTLKEEFQEEVQKSWSEYVDQVGLEMAESTPYFQEALNQVLAKGKQLF